MRARHGLHSIVLIFGLTGVFGSHAFGAGNISAPTPSVSITGKVQHPETLTLGSLQKLPPTTVQASLMTDKGALAGSFTGALLVTVLKAAGPIDDPGKNAYLRHVYIVTASDGYAVALSQGEIDPSFGGEPAILAWAKDGKPLDTGIRLIIPTDKRAARAVRDVTSIEVR
jgi:DMSO/TMAO reductase YedYZ molybdopterin-dependent catalytic subunit